MTETIYSEEAPAMPATLVPTPSTETALYDALYMHGGFTAHVQAEGFAIAEDGYAVASGSDRVRLPADTTFAMFGYALGMLLAEHPRMAAIGARLHDSHVELEPMEIFGSRGAAENTGRMLDRIARHDSRVRDLAGTTRGTHPAGTAH